MKKIALFLCLTLLLIITSGCVKSTSPATTEFPPIDENNNGNEVIIINYNFQPSQISIKKGETITWANRDTVEHTVTSDKGTELDSELLSPEDTYSHTFNEVGSFPYHCTQHPSMKGKVSVTE